MTKTRPLLNAANRKPIAPEFDDLLALAQIDPRAAIEQAFRLGREAERAAREDADSQNSTR